MRRVAWCMFLLCAGLAQMPERAELRLLFERALVLEETQNRLEEAIELYERVVAESLDKELAARAQLRIGICYDQLGRREAQHAFRAVIDNFPDQQRVVAEARARLERIEAATRVPEEVLGSPGFRKIRIPLELSQDSGLQVSPDESQIAFTAGGFLWVMPMKGEVDPTVPGAPQRLTDDMGAYGPVSWSADGAWIAFNARREGERLVYVIPSQGGLPVSVPVEPDPGYIINGLRLSLSPKGGTLAYSTVVTRSEYSTLTIPVRGGQSELVASNWSIEPSFSPDGQRVAYMKGQPIRGWPKEKSELWVWSPDGNRKILEIEGHCWSPVWSPDGSRISFFRQVSEPPDQKVELQIVKANETADNARSWRVELPFVPMGFLAGWSRENRIAIVKQEEPHTAIYTVPASGGMATQVTPNGPAAHPRWAADGSSIFFRWDSGCIASVPKGGGTVSVLPGLDEAGVVEATSGGGNNISPDGQFVVFAAYGPERPISGVHIYTMPVEGGQPVQLSFGPQQDRFPCWSPRGDRIAFVRAGHGEDVAVWLISPSGGVPVRVSTPSHNVAWAPIHWSPDGRFIACYSKDGTIQMIPVGGGAAVRLAEIPNVNSHNELSWSPDGRLAYASGGRIWVLAAGAGLPIEIRTGLNARIFHLDWSPDGETIAFRASSDRKLELWLMEDFLHLLDR
jgi:Tol biopolymer transport system component